MQKSGIKSGTNWILGNNMILLNRRIKFNVRNVIMYKVWHKIEEEVRNEIQTLVRYRIRYEYDMKSEPKP